RWVIGDHCAGTATGRTNSASTARTSTWTFIPISISSSSISSRFITNRGPSTSSTNATMYPSWNGGRTGWCITTKLTSSPAPDIVRVDQSSEWHAGHIGTGGWRSSVHESQRCTEIRPAFSSSKKNALSRLTGGRGRNASLIAGPLGCVRVPQRPESHRSDRPRFLIGVGGQGGDEVTGAEFRSLRLRNMLDSFLTCQHITRNQVAGVLLFAVDRDDIRIPTVAQEVVGPFHLAGSGCIGVLAGREHVPHLQGTRRRDHIGVSGRRSEFRVQIDRVAVTQSITQMMNHRTVDRVSRYGDPAAARVDHPLNFLAYFIIAHQAFLASISPDLCTVDSRLVLPFVSNSRAIRSRSADVKGRYCRS